MDRILEIAFRQGYERMAAWSGLLDEINLFPVADADTGRNLRISLSPLKWAAHKNTARQLLLSATGNSGNIAGAYFSKFVQLESSTQLPKAAAVAKEAAWQALMDPKAGTMLSVFDALDAALQASSNLDIPQQSENILNEIKQAVLQTSQLLPELQSADVVDSGALGMFLFFEGFLCSVAQRADAFCSPHRAFGSKVRINNKNSIKHYNTYCIDSVIVPAGTIKEATQDIGRFGSHVVAHSDGRHLKIHLHAENAETARQRMASVGDVIQWRSEKIIDAELRPSETLERVHVVTDAAGSLSAEEARELGVTLLDSYILIADMHLPETAVMPETLYSAMKRGVRVTTAQASTFERRQVYEYLTQRYNQILYLSVGSAYTGNYEAARRWVAENEDIRHMTVIDSGAASGRLGLIARCVARYANLGGDGTDIARFARDVGRRCNELVFLDQLKYLAAGGRISKANGFLGDLLKLKPVIRPGSGGAQKVGIVRNRQDQVRFALDHLGHGLESASPMEILLQYTDNQDWVTSHVQPRIQALLPQARIQTSRMSLTAGVHMGPGTWAVAYLPALTDSECT
jgi:uncharacterized protein